MFVVAFPSFLFSFHFTVCHDDRIAGRSFFICILLANEWNSIEAKWKHRSLCVSFVLWSYWAIQDIGRHGRPLAGWFVEGIRRRVDHAENHHLIHAANDVAISESGWEHTQSFRWLTDKLGFDRLSHRLFGQSNYLNALIEICENGQKWIIFRCITLSSLPLVWSFVRGAVLPAIHANVRRCTHSLTANFIR